MNMSTPLKSAFITRKFKTYAALALAILGIILAIIAFGSANDQMAVIHELASSMTQGSLGFVTNVIKLFI